MRPRPHRRTAARTAALLAVAASSCAPPATEVTPLRLAAREPVSADTLERVEALTFRLPSGDAVSAYLRLPLRAREGSLGGVVLVAGRETGRRAAGVIPGPLETAVLAVEYPQELPEGLGLGSLLARLPEIRASGLRMPGILSGAGRFLAAQPEVDSTRIALVGVSFGVPFAAAAADDPVFRGLALHHGGAGLELILRENLPVESRVLRRIAAGFLAWYFRSLEPARHVDDLGATPVLLINGTRDTAVPPEAALRLAAAASGPVRHIWLPHDHLMPGDTAVMRELADSTLSHFDFLRPGG